MGMNRIKLAFRERSVPPSELHRNIIKPTRRKTAIEMPHSRNNHSHDWHLDVGPGLIENKEVETLLLGDAHAFSNLLAGVHTPEHRPRARLDCWLVAWGEKRVVMQTQRCRTIEA